MERLSDLISKNITLHKRREAKPKIFHVGPDYFERVMAEPEPESVVSFATSVLESDRIVRLPRRRTPITYDEARLAMWIVIKERLAHEGRTFQPDEHTVRFIRQLLAWGCQLSGPVQGSWGTFDAELDPRRGLWVYGKPGVGKTFLIECFTVAMAALGHLDRAFRFINMKVLEQQLRASRNLAMLNKFTSGFWILDDVGFEKASKIWGNVVEPFEVIINHRYERFKRGRILTIVTSNYPMIGPNGEDVIKEAYGPRLASRVHEMFQPVYLPGEDKRRMI